MIPKSKRRTRRIVTKKTVYVAEYWSGISDDWTQVGRQYYVPVTVNAESSTLSGAIDALNRYAANYPVHKTKIPTRIRIVTTRTETIPGITPMTER